MNKFLIGKNWSNLDRKIIIKFGSNYNNWSNLQQKYWSNLDQTMWTKFRLMDINQVFKEQLIKLWSDDNHQLC